MRDLTALLLTLAVTAPVACAHDDRDAESPVRPAPASAGNDTGPSPPGTGEPVVPGVPNASQGELDDPGAAPTLAATFPDSRSTINKPGAIAQVGPGGSSGGGGTLGTGGTFGGMGGTYGGGGKGGTAIGR